MASNSQVPFSQASGAIVAATGTDGDDVVHISDGEEEEEGGSGSKRKLRSDVWNDFQKVRVDGVWKAKCNHCSRKLSAVSRNGSCMCHAPILQKSSVMHCTSVSNAGILIAGYPVTLDNCSINDSMVGLMESRLGAANMLLKGKWLHMRCCAHILNLIVKDGLDVIATAISNIRESGLRK